MNIELLPEAEADLVDGFFFYEHQREGLGEYFINSLFSDIDSLRIYAGVHEAFGKYLRMLAKRFPYAIYYKPTGDKVQVYAILDCRRDPLWHGKRLGLDT